MGAVALCTRNSLYEVGSELPVSTARVGFSAPNRADALKRALAQLCDEVVNSHGEDTLTEEEKIIEQQSEVPDELIKQEMKGDSPGGWAVLQSKLEVPVEPVTPEKKVVETGERVVHGFRVIPTKEKVLLQLGLIPKGEQAQKLLSAFIEFVKRELLVDVEVGTLDGWKCPCTELNERREEVDEVILLLYFDKYATNKTVDSFFLTNLFSIIHKKMRGEKTHEVDIPKGKSYLTWLIRDILRFFWRFAKLETLVRIIQRVSIKQRKPLKLRFHDLHNLKSVCSTAEWRFIAGEALEPIIAQVQEMKSHLVKYKAYDYDKVIAMSSRMALDKFGKPALSILYDRLKKRNELKIQAAKMKKATLAIPLETVLFELRKANSFAGVHLIIPVLSLRPGDLPALKKMTTFVNFELKGNDERFSNMEDYLSWCREHPTSKEDSLREVDNDLRDEDFPHL